MKQLTVCVPVYNAGKYLNKSIGSILNQDFTDFNLICYDDGSTDDSLEVLKSFDDSRIRIIDGKKNRGGMYARSQLINAVDTKYCMWLDADDEFCRNDAFSYALRKIKSNDYDMVNFTRRYEVDSNGKEEVNEPIIYGDFSYCGDKLFEKFYPSDNHVNFPSKIFKSDIIMKCLPENEILQKRFVGDDWFFSAMWFFYAKRYLNVATDEPIFRYRKDIGIWGSNLKDISPKRIGDLCVLQYNVLVSLYNRMVAVRPLNKIEVSNLIAGTNFPMVAKMIKVARKMHGDEYADSLMNIWHSAFGKDGVHLLNEIEQFATPDYIMQLESIMKTV